MKNFVVRPKPSRTSWAYSWVVFRPVQAIIEEGIFDRRLLLTSVPSDVPIGCVNKRA